MEQPIAPDDETTAGSNAASLADAEKPSCRGCRKRKIKCSREHPTCAHCQRLEVSCVYDDKKNKPGIKLGAVESLSRRIEALENAFSERHLERSSESGESLPAGTSSHTQSQSQTNRGDDSLQGMLGVLSNLCMELCKLNNNNNANNQTNTPLNPSTNPPLAPPPPPASESVPSHRERSQHLTTASPASTTSSSWHHQQNASNRYGLLDAYETTMRPRKRRRTDSCGNPNIELQLPLADMVDASATLLPSAELLEEITNVYFMAIQPWIPILHETRFRARLHEPEQLPSMVVVVHALVVAALRFAHPEEHGLSVKDVENMTRRSRSLVVLTAMDSLSVENLQALIIVAFDDIGNGNASKAWSIVGSLTRTVEYLQLSVEHDDHHTQPLLRPLLSLPPAQRWLEEEERRRVFWTIFNLDRFCSVATGWNTSLTADDVHRRLPAEGGFWYKDEAVATPYFGIWDRSVAKIGNSIAFLPAHYPSPEQMSTDTGGYSAGLHESPQSSSYRGAARTTSQHHHQPDMSTVGAFAYCIEATESLSRVTTFFLQQRIDFNDTKAVSSWLTRFKELDLRLVHWKMFLPQKWKDSNISRQPTLINMDPNLTLAHLTHNTSMILLHQRVAYPPADWGNIVRLPSSCSAETCQNAAIETQNITAKYLRYTHPDRPVANQFAFCAFVAARVLLVHWRYYSADLPPELWQLVDSLDDMAKRWLGATTTGRHSQCLAGKYANHLRDLHARCIADPSFSVDVLGYSTVVSNQNSGSAHGSRGQLAAVSGQSRGLGQQQQQQSPMAQQQAYLGTRQNDWSAVGTPQQQSHTYDGRSAWQTLDRQSQVGGGNPSAGGSGSQMNANTNTTVPPNGNGPVRSTADHASPHNPLPQMPYGTDNAPRSIDYGTPNGVSPTDELSAISYMLMDQRFMDMDRVISLDNMTFSTAMEMGGVGGAGTGTGLGDGPMDMGLPPPDVNRQA